MRIWCLFIVLLVLSACGEEDTVAPATTFALAIDNRVATSYDVYRATSATGPFTKVGHALSGMTYWIRGLDVDTTWYFRLVPPGSGTDVFHYERSVSSSGEDVVWVVQ